MSDSQQRYRVVEKLESGGMAEVFRAESEGLQGFKKQVAIKRVLPQLSEKKKFISMFLDEARLSAQLNHSNCVQVFDIGVGDNAYFIVMEFVDGANLKTISESLRKQGMEFPVSAAAFVAHEICKGLAYAHEMSDAAGQPLHIVHRDMSPPNVLVTKYGEIKIVDFGLAKANSQLERSDPGIIKGKFSYLSPEAAVGLEIDARTDIFAVGIILWELLSGSRLFLGDTDFQTVKRVQQAIVPSISGINPSVPPELERIVNRALARDPTTRYGTARELGRDLSTFLFAYGQPVSTFDIADLVHLALREKQKLRPRQGSIIDKLIEEALLEFTSLTDDRGGPPGAARNNSSLSRHEAAIPLTPEQFIDPTNWSQEPSSSHASISHPGVRRPTLPPQVFDEGNLSAIEDMADPRIPPPPRIGNLSNVLRGLPNTNSPKAGPSVNPGAVQALNASTGDGKLANSLPTNGTLAVPIQGKKSTNTIVVGVAVCLVAVAVAAAWFAQSMGH